MTGQALDTLPREAKGPLSPPPALDGPIRAVVDALVAWLEVEATTHWRLNEPDKVDGVDFYVGPDELEHFPSRLTREGIHTGPRV